MSDKTISLSDEPATIEELLSETNRIRRMQVAYSDRERLLEQVHA